MGLVKYSCVLLYFHAEGSNVRYHYGRQCRFYQVRTDIFQTFNNRMPSHVVGISSLLFEVDIKLSKNEVLFLQYTCVNSLECRIFLFVLMNRIRFHFALAHRIRWF